jgi:transcriptional regulator of acetoin/glycerol metabolism
MEHLPYEIREPGAESSLAVLKENRATLKEMEKAMLLETLQRTAGNRKQAARILDINVSTLYRKMKAMGIEFNKKGNQMSEKTGFRKNEDL